ncbi:unnamed protein product [Closterium sp. NIES-54]
MPVEIVRRLPSTAASQRSVAGQPPCRPALPARHRLLQTVGCTSRAPNTQHASRAKGHGTYCCTSSSPSPTSSRRIWPIATEHRLKGKVLRLCQEIRWLLGSQDVPQYELPALHHLLQPCVALLHVLEFAFKPQALSDHNGRRVIHPKDIRRLSIEQLEFCKEEAKAASSAAATYPDSVD